MKNQKGITLIALVITIIVLLILAGVSISMVIGNNGILNQASTAKIESIGGSEKEQVELAFLSAKAKQLRGEFTVIDDEKLKTELTANGVMENVSTVEYDSTAKQLKVTFKSGNVFYLENDIVTWNREESGVLETPDTDKVYLESAEWDYTLENGEATLTKYKVSGATTVTIPNYVRVDDEDIPITKVEGNIIEEYDEGASIWQDVSSSGLDYWPEQTSIEEIIVSEGIKEINAFAFSATINLKKVTLPNSLSVIGQNAFLLCKNLITINIPNGVKTIGQEAFANCSSLTSLTIPSSVTRIDSYAFGACYKLEEVKFEMTTVPTFGNRCFESYSTITFYFKNSTVANALKSDEDVSTGYHYQASKGTKSDNYSW